jgi:hypothetical protein
LKSDFHINHFSSTRYRNKKGHDRSEMDKSGGKAKPNEKTEDKRQTEKKETRT